MEIPKIFHQFWTGKPMPHTYREFQQSWKRLHPNWELIFWGVEQPLPQLRNQDIFDRAAEICPGYEGQLRADILRYELLLEHGGVWIDTDMECIKPIDKLLEGVTCFCAWCPKPHLNNAILGAIPGHPFIQKLVEQLPQSVADNPGEMPRVISGPRFMGRVYQANPEIAQEVKVYPQRYFYPYLWNELSKWKLRTEKTYAVHHWNNRRRERNRPIWRER